MNANTPKRHQPVVLVVDDDIRARIILREALEQADFVVEEADDGGPALECFKQLQPDLVLLDVVMPEMDGFETCLEIRKLPSGAHTPIVLMTGLDDTDSINRAFEIGATSFVTKPINYLLLTHRIKYLLRSKHTADQLRDSERQLAKAQSLAKIGHWEWDPQNGRVICSESLRELASLPDEQGHLGYREFLGLVDPSDQHRVRTTIYRALKSKRGFAMDYRITPSDGAERVIYLEAEVCHDEHGGIEKVIGIAQDITERRRSEEKIRYLAFFDSVTGLPNRTLLKQIFNHTLANAKRYKRNFALLFLDLDHFKTINDTLGHDAGDELLIEVGKRLRGCLRSSDRLATADRESGPFPGGTVGGDAVTRLGGDEFVVLLTEIRSPENAAIVARRMSDALATPILAGGKNVVLTFSIGIAVYPLDGQDFDVLLKRADSAMYQAKEQGRNCARFFMDSLNEHAVKRFSLESELRNALEKNQFTIHYQPKINLQDDRLVGVEALVRWRHPIKGMLTASEFVPVAEEIGLIVPIGDWVLHQVFAQAARWKNEGGENFEVSLNLSALQMTRPNIKEKIVDLLTKYELSPELIELQITELFIAENADSCLPVIQDLSDMGFKIALDDFGVGYSSWSRIKSLPLTSLNIDRSFIGGLNTDPQNKAIVRAIIDLAHGLDLVAVAEGIENEDQLKLVRGWGCDQVQGFLFSRPLPPEEVETWPASRKTSAMPVAKEHGNGFDQSLVFLGE